METEVYSPTHVFTPGAPIDNRDFFAGRIQQLKRVIETIPSPGRHPIIFGQRGVGKTSLANMLGTILPDVWAVKVNCDGSDTFASIWERVLQKASLSFKKAAFGFSQKQIEQRITLRQLLSHDGDIGPSHVAQVLDIMKTQAVFILDEFDRVNDNEAKSCMADLIKNISDNNRHVTITLVGVGESIAELIGEHPSVQRNLVQIELPPMSGEEIKTIITKGCDLLGIKVRSGVLDAIAQLANGLPHYAHLLGLSIARACKLREVQKMDIQLFDSLGCSLAVEDAIETYRHAFTVATRTSKLSRYPRILCACAHAKHDDNGVFRATDVVEAMQNIFQDSISVPSVVPALGEFCNPERGLVLSKIPVGDRSHYRFTDPMMRPFLRIKAKALI